MTLLGIFSNFGEVFKSLHLGRPKLVSTFIDHDTTLSHSGLLQKTCPRVQKHNSLRGTSSDGLFLSRSAAGLSSKFWKQCFSGLETANSLREGEVCWNSVSHSTELPQQEGLPSLASAVSSLSVLYNRWKDGKLSRNILKDFALGEDPEPFFRR